MEDFWRVLGFDSDEVRVYEDFVDHMGQSRSERIERLQLDPNRWEAAVAALERHRFIRAVDGSYEAMDARTAIPALVRSRQAALEQAGGVADELGRRLTATRRIADPSAVITVLAGADAVLAAVLHALSNARTSVSGTVAPPYVTGPRPDVFLAERDVIARGLPFRCLYDSSAMEDPITQAHVWAAAEAGEDARLLTKMHLKLILIDGDTAIMPLSPHGDTTDPSALLINSSAMTHALQDLFDILFAQATPLTPRPSSEEQSTTDRIVDMLLAGMSDNAIAASMGISERTFRRRLQLLHAQHRAANRVQLGAALSLSRQSGTTDLD